MHSFNSSYDEENNQWVARHPKHPTFQAISNAGSVLGTKEWTLHNDSQLCNGANSYTRILSFSSCGLDQFTCSSGHCVDINRR